MMMSDCITHLSRECVFEETREINVQEGLEKPFEVLKSLQCQHNVDSLSTHEWMQSRVEGNPEKKGLMMPDKTRRLVSIDSVFGVNVLFSTFLSGIQDWQSCQSCSLLYSFSLYFCLYNSSLSLKLTLNLYLCWWRQHKNKKSSLHSWMRILI